MAAKSLLYGQQLGWCKADIVYSPKHVAFLKKYVDARCKYTDVFNRAKLLRPPVVETNLPKLVTPAGLWFGGDIVTEQVLCNAWKYRDGSKIYILTANISEDTAEYTFKFNLHKYGPEKGSLPKEFTVDDGICTVSGSLNKCDIKVWKIDCQKS